MNSPHVFALTLVSLLTLSSCTEASKKPAETQAPAQTRIGNYGEVFHFEDLMKRGGDEVSILKSALEENTKVVLDFYAEWCGPCKKLGPILDKLAGKYQDIMFIKINVDQFRSISDAYSVKSLPTLMLFKDGKRVEKTTGFKSESDIKTMLQKLD